MLLSGPAGTGKSRACLEKLLMCALANPGMRGLIVRKTRESLGSTALVTWREHVIPEALRAGVVVFYGGSNEEPPQYRFANGSKIMIGGMDKPTKIMSSEYDMAYVQEATELTVEDLEAITTRLRNGKMSFQQLIMDCNPGAPTHWLKLRADRGALRMYNCTHEENPRLFDEIDLPDGLTEYKVTERGSAYIAKLDALTGVRYLRLRKGIWAAAEGVIYEDFGDVHVLDRFEIPVNWRRWWAVDFGYTNPFCLQMWAEDPDGRLYLYREIYHTKRTIDQHVAEALRVVSDPDPNDPESLRARRWREPKPFQIVCDHDAQGRAQFESAIGLGTVPAVKAVDAGIQEVQQRLRLAGDGRPRLFILRDSVVRRDPDLVDRMLPTCTLEEMPAYVWDLREGKPPREEPVKENDHGMDPMRYLCAELAKGRPQVRST